MYATCWRKQGERALSQLMCVIKVKILSAPDSQTSFLFFLFANNFHTAAANPPPTPLGHRGGLLSAEIMKPNKSRSQFSFHTKTKGSGAGSPRFIAAVQRRGRQLIC